ncbi:hypothetical protein [Nonlabens sp.]|uniref:hypothetical protein n=1 Tax=Nonlabens sp. TaxID=1888209 RepID=UPI0025D59C79|nr:hypothetical protein [Nonlabens sp.]
MRKLVVAALAGVFMWSSGFSSNEIDDLESDPLTDNVDFFDCTYDVVATRTNVFGQVIREVRTYTLNTLGREDCEGHINYHLTALRLGIIKW